VSVGPATRSLLQDEARHAPGLWAQEVGFVRGEGARRIYSIDAAPLIEIDAWLDSFRGFWEHRLESLATEVARGKRERKRSRDAAGVKAAGAAPPAGRPRTKKRA